MAPSSEKKRDKVLNDAPKTGGIQTGTHFGSSQSRQTIFFNKFQSKSTRNYENIKKTQEMLDYHKSKRFSFHQEAGEKAAQDKKVEEIFSDKKQEFKRIEERNQELMKKINEAQEQFKQVQITSLQPSPKNQSNPKQAGEMPFPKMQTSQQK